MSEVVRVSDEAYEELSNADKNIKELVDELVLDNDTMDEPRVREICREEIEEYRQAW